MVCINKNLEIHIDPEKGFEVLQSLSYNSLQIRIRLREQNQAQIIHKTSYKRWLSYSIHSTANSCHLCHFLNMLFFFVSNAHIYKYEYNVETGITHFDTTKQSKNLSQFTSSLSPVVLFVCHFLAKLHKGVSSRCFYLFTNCLSMSITCCLIVIIRLMHTPKYTYFLIVTN